MTESNTASDLFHLLFAMKWFALCCVCVVCVVSRRIVIDNSTNMMHQFASASNQTPGSIHIFADRGVFDFGMAEIVVRRGQELIVTGAGEKATILNARGLNRHFNVFGSDHNSIHGNQLTFLSNFSVATLSNLSLVNGRAIGHNHESRGGAVFIQDKAVVQLTNVYVQQNEAIKGGAIQCNIACQSHSRSMQELCMLTTILRCTTVPYYSSFTFMAAFCCSKGLS